MALFERTIPKEYRTKFTAAVAARRVVNAKMAAGKTPTSAELNRDYRAMNALPLMYQVVAVKRAK